MKNWIIIFLSFLAVSCQTVLDVEVPSIPEKPVLFASLNSSGQYHKLQLTKSRPLVNNSPSDKFEAITNAKVELIGNGNTYSFYYSEDEYRSSLPFDLVSGETYVLQATMADGKVLSAQQKMPKAPENFQMTIDSIESDWGKQYNLEVKWNDDQNATNFYRIEAYSVVDQDTQKIYIPQEYYDDSKAKNGIFQQKTEIFAFVFDDNGPREDFNLFLVITEINEDHFNYGVALQDYNPQNPFSEPKPLPTNVEGGLGMFTLSGSRIIWIR